MRNSKLVHVFVPFLLMSHASVICETFNSHQENSGACPRVGGGWGGSPRVHHFNNFPLILINCEESCLAPLTSRLAAETRRVTSTFSAELVMCVSVASLTTTPFCGSGWEVCSVDVIVQQWSLILDRIVDTMKISLQQVK